MLKFTKMQGLGNDYVYMNAIEQEIKDESFLAQFVSNRHFGIGSDGLILICLSQVADFKMRMFNQDGSEAEICGNGIRCVGKFVYDKGLTKKTDLTIETLAGIKKLKLSVKEGIVESVQVDMGEPILDPNEIPVLSQKYPVKDLSLTVENKEFSFTCVSMGNPHAVTFLNGVDSFEVEKYGKKLEINPVFPQKANIEFIEVVSSQRIKMRVWERGSGETMACGTGACASVVACILNRLTQRAVTVELLGGNLQIEWRKEDNHIYMTGPAQIVFEGVLEEGWEKDELY